MTNKLERGDFGIDESIEHAPTNNAPGCINRVAAQGNALYPSQQ
jgi:hypothetical protein